MKICIISLMDKALTVMFYYTLITKSGEKDWFYDSKKLRIPAMAEKRIPLSRITEAWQQYPDCEDQEIHVFVTGAEQVRRLTLPHGVFQENSGKVLFIYMHQDATTLSHIFLPSTRSIHQNPGSCNLFRWSDPSLCKRAKVIISELLLTENQQKMKNKSLESVNEQSKETVSPLQNAKASIEDEYKELKMDNKGLDGVNEQSEEMERLLQNKKARQLKIDNKSLESVNEKSEEMVRPLQNEKARLEDENKEMRNMMMKEKNQQHNGNINKYLFSLAVVFCLIWCLGRVSFEVGDGSINIKIRV